MLYWLVEFSDKLSVLNVFRYITFRTGGAVITGLVFVFLFGQFFIDRLRLLQGKGQPIRSDGPQSHIIKKAGTPTMGGLMILSGMLVSTLLWANPANAQAMCLHSTSKPSCGGSTWSNSSAPSAATGWPG